MTLRKIIATSHGSVRRCARSSVSLFAKFILLYVLAGVAPFGITSASAQTFSDVPLDHWAYDFVESLAASGITSGCGGGRYCPDDPVTRAQMAVFLERGIYGSAYIPPAAAGTVFDDVGASDFAAAFIEQLFADGITGGCDSNNYCPSDDVTRAQMAVFLLRAKYGSGFVPFPAVGLFADVAPGDFAADFIEALSIEGITTGCGGGNFCPQDAVTRAQMAVFLVRTFNLPIILPPQPLRWDEGKWDQDDWQ
jgi:hypothetical protein